MKTAVIMERMIAFSQGNRHDISHLMKVYGYARTIGMAEGLDEETQETLEIAAIVHDIACPLCRSKYGHADGRKQEEEGPALVRQLLNGVIGAEQLERVCWLVGHHHTCTGVSAPDHQILLEADYLVNADEGGAPREQIEQMEQRVFKTACGKRLLKNIYL